MTNALNNIYHLSPSDHHLGKYCGLPYDIDRHCLCETQLPSFQRDLEEVRERTHAEVVKLRFGKHAVSLATCIHQQPY